LLLFVAAHPWKQASVEERSAEGCRDPEWFERA